MAPPPESVCVGTSTVPSGFLIHILPGELATPVNVKDSRSPFDAET